MGLPGGAQLFVIAGQKSISASFDYGRIERAMMDSMQHYVHDYRGYLAWISGHPGNFVINTYTRPSSAYLKTSPCDMPDDQPAPARRAHLHGWPVQQALRQPGRTGRACSPARRNSAALSALSLMRRAPYAACAGVFSVETLSMWLPEP